MSKKFVDDDEQFEFETADNPESRCPVVLLLDNSSSMRGEPIKELCQGLKLFKQNIIDDEIASLRVEVAIITFGGQPKMVHDFSSVDEIELMELSATGDTPMGAAIEMALDSLEKRKNMYKKFHLDYYQPWLILITDGEPTDNYHRATIRIKDSVAKDKLYFLAIGVENANIDKLRDITGSEFPPALLKTTSFKSLFKWISDSLSQKSVSGQQLTKDDFDEWIRNIK
jgi:uncharacterized protein YegL